jgi:MscS family membrane protein
MVKILLPSEFIKNMIKNFFSKSYFFEQTTKMNLFGLFFFWMVLAPNAIFSESPLTPLKLDSPRDTMKVFMESMNKYKKGVETQNDDLIMEIEKATRCLDTSKLNPLVRVEKAREAAIFLKEVLDRVYPLNLQEIPGDSAVAEANPIPKWYVPDTEILIVLRPNENLDPEYLFSAETVSHASEYFRRTKHMPYLKNSGGGASYQLPWMERVFPAWAQKKYWFLHLWQWMGLGLAILLGTVLRYISRFLFFILLKLARKTDTEWDDKILQTLGRPVGYILGVGFWYLFLFGSGIEGKPYAVIDFILKLFMGFAFVYFVYNLSDLVVSIMKHNAIQSKAPIDDQLIPLLSKSIRIFFVIVGILIAIQNMGVNVMSLIAGLGIGGLAIALAAKDTAANLFGSAMIFMDRPFKIGDHIIIDGKEGIVEEIGFRSTRIRTWDDSLVSLPNSIVANANIENMGARRHRRSVILLSVTYDTSPEKMEAFLEGIKYILQKNPLVVPELTNVAFRGFGDSALSVLMQFSLSVDSFPKMLEGRQLVFLEVMKLAKELDITFAFPTRTVHVETYPGLKPNRIPKEQTIKTYKSKASEFKEGGRLSQPEGMGIFIAPYRELPGDLQK